jgi:hypothetical protein
MCTLSLITRTNGYLLAMNRDEKVARGAGSLPEIYRRDGVRMAHPGDGSSGTWIGVNEFGIALAVLNWNEPSPSAAKTQSRGGLIPRLLSCSSIADLDPGIGNLDLCGILPFRLVAVAPREEEIWEWRWDSSRLQCCPHRWRARHWFSSSLSDQEAEKSRSKACRLAWEEANAGSSSWLRRLHGSHENAAPLVPGPFGLCVHRPDVRTLSYSEVECASSCIRFSHWKGSPCSTLGRGAFELEFERNAALIQVVRN